MAHTGPGQIERNPRRAPDATSCEKEEIPAKTPGKETNRSFGSFAQTINDERPTNLYHELKELANPIASQEVYRARSDNDQERLGAHNAAQGRSQSAPRIAWSLRQCIRNLRELVVRSEYRCAGYQERGEENE